MNAKELLKKLRINHLKKQAAEKLSARYNVPLRGPVGTQGFKGAKGPPGNVKGKPTTKEVQDLAAKYKMEDMQLKRSVNATRTLDDIYTGSNASIVNYITIRTDDYYKRKAINELTADTVLAIGEEVKSRNKEILLFPYNIAEYPYQFLVGTHRIAAFNLDDTLITALLYVTPAGRSIKDAFDICQEESMEEFIDNVCVIAGARC